LKKAVIPFIYKYLRLQALALLCIITASSSAQRQAIDSIYFNNVLKAREGAQGFFQTLQYTADLTLLSAYTEYDKVWPNNKDFVAKPYLLQAQINTPVPIGGKWAKTVKGGLRFALFFHPDFDIRLLRNDKSRGDSSTPIRTPSFKPGITIFITQSKLWDDRRDKHYFAFKVYHHSNGQDGTHFRPQDNGYYNRYNGDFSDFVIFQFIYGGFYSWDHMPVDTTKKLYNSRYNRVLYTSSNIYWKAAFTFYPPQFIDSVLNVRSMYGKYRTEVQLGWIFAPVYQEGIRGRHDSKFMPMYQPEKKERFRVYLDMEYIWDVPYRSGPLQNLQNVAIYDITKRLNISLTGSYRIWGTPFAGLFAQVGYYGCDPYNVYFQQSMFFVRAGLSAGFLMYKNKHQPLNDR
jgi:hypothetical protein